MMVRPLQSLVAVLGSVIGATTALAADFQVSTALLDNGLFVAVVEDHRAPIVTQMLYYRAGSADELPHQRGIAHFLEHMMFQGTSTTPGAEFRGVIARYGGRENATTSQDTTTYFQTVGKEALELVMRLEADRMHNLVIDQRAFNSEKEVVREERRGRYENEPGGAFGEQYTAAQYLVHPYGNPIIGHMHEIEALTLQDAVDWYKKWYVPNNATLVIAGDTTMDEVLPLAQKYYGAVPRGPELVRFRPKEPPQLAERRVIMYDPRVRQPSLSRSYLAPSQTARDGTAEALTILASALSGSTGRFYQSLVVEQGLAASAGAGYGGTALNDTTFGIFASPRRGVDPAVVERALDAEIERLLRDGITAEEVELAKSGIIDGLIFARDNVMGLARRVGNGLSIGMTVEEVTALSDRIKSVTVARVNEAAKRVLDKRRSVTGMLLPPATPAPAAPAGALAAPTPAAAVRP
jgi:zinc protease